MPEIRIYTISLLRDGNYRIIRATTSGDVSAPIILNRLAMEDYFRATKLVRGTLTQAWEDLDRVGIVEFTVIE
jgi:hypothetical protein